jgi:hypothetical protein
MSEFPNNYDEKDTHALESFRLKLKKCLEGGDNNSPPQLSASSADHLREKLTDSDCLRFIRARKHDVDKAVLMAVKWSQVLVTSLHFTPLHLHLRH